MSPTVSIPCSLNINEADWSEQTPDATPHSWYGFFVPNCIQQMVKRRVAQFETCKLLCQMVCCRDTASLRIATNKLMRDQEVMRVPALNSEARGKEAIEALRAHVLQAISVSSTRIVDMYHENAEETVLNIRGIVTAQQDRPLFPNLPVGKPYSCGVHLSIEMNDAWRPKSTCWEFIPLEPLLDLAAMQDLMNSPAPSATSSPSSSQPSSADAVSKENDLDATPPLSMEEHHARGTCTPCSFFAFKIDGCRQGDACPFCHLCTAKQAKVRRKQQKKEAKAEAAAKLQ